MGALGGQILDHSTRHNVQGGLNVPILVYPYGGVQEVNFLGIKVIVYSPFTFKFDGGMEGIQEVDKLQELCLRTCPVKQDVIFPNCPISPTFPVCLIYPLCHSCPYIKYALYVLKVKKIWEVERYTDLFLIQTNLCLMFKN